MPASSAGKGLALILLGYSIFLVFPLLTAVRIAHLNRLLAYGLFLVLGLVLFGKYLNFPEARKIGAERELRNSIKFDCFHALCTFLSAFESSSAWLFMGGSGLLGYFALTNFLDYLRQLFKHHNMALFEERAVVLKKFLHLYPAGTVLAALLVMSSSRFMEDLVFLLAAPLRFGGPGFFVAVALGVVIWKLVLLQTLGMAALMFWSRSWNLVFFSPGIPDLPMLRMPSVLGSASLLIPVLKIVVIGLVAAYLWRADLTSSTLWLALVSLLSLLAALFILTDVAKEAALSSDVWSMMGYYIALAVVFVPTLFLHSGLGAILHMRTMEALLIGLVVVVLYSFARLIDKAGGSLGRGVPAWIFRLTLLIGFALTALASELNLSKGTLLSLLLLWMFFAGLQLHSVVRELNRRIARNGLLE